MVMLNNQRVNRKRLWKVFFLSENDLLSNDHFRSLNAIGGWNLDFLLVSAPTSIKQNPSASSASSLSSSSSSHFHSLQLDQQLRSFSRQFGCRCEPLSWDSYPNSHSVLPLTPQFSKKITIVVGEISYKFHEKSEKSPLLSFLLWLNPGDLPLLSCLDFFWAPPQRCLHGAIHPQWLSLLQRAPATMRSESSRLANNAKETMRIWRWKKKREKCL